MAASLSLSSVAEEVGCRCHVPEPRAALGGDHSSHHSQLLWVSSPFLLAWPSPAGSLIGTVPHLLRGSLSREGRRSGGVAAEGSFLPTAEAALELVRAGPWAAPPTHCPRSCVASKGTAPAGLGFMSLPWSPAHLLCLALAACAFGSTHHKCEHPCCGSASPALPMGCEGVSSSCPALGRERDVGRCRGV